jgi:adenylate cyclase
MLDNPGNTYSFFVEPLPGRITARRGEHLVAASDRAKVMYETRLPPVIYFPIEDTHFLSSEENNHRTFCPFKGTAHYHDVTLPATTIQNGAWSYPRALVRHSRSKATSLSIQRNSSCPAFRNG